MLMRVVLVTKSFAAFQSYLALLCGGSLATDLRKMHIHSHFALSPHFTLLLFRSGHNFGRQVLIWMPKERKR